jgi:hypothetical protein
VYTANWDFYIYFDKASFVMFLKKQSLKRAAMDFVLNEIGKRISLTFQKPQAILLEALSSNLEEALAL